MCGRSDCGFNGGTLSLIRGFVGCNMVEVFTCQDDEGVNVLTLPIDWKRIGVANCCKFCTQVDD